VNGSSGDDKVFDVGEQPPGQANDRTLRIEKKGETIVQCQIHPKMKMKIEAE
jgi:ferredoxin